MFISTAWAQAGDGGGGAGIGFVEFLPFILIFAVFYFLLIRPQQKKMKMHRQTVAAVERGDSVVTGGGIIGNVTKIVDANEVIVEIAEGVRVRVGKSTLMEVIPKGRPAKSVSSGKK